MSPRQVQTAKPHCVNYVNWSLGTLWGREENGKAQRHWDARGPTAHVRRQTGTKSQKWKAISLSMTLGDTEESN